MNEAQREAQLLQAMAKATLSEQPALMSDLNELRRVRAQRIESERSIDLGNAIVGPTRTPVYVHGASSKDSDWMDEVDVESDDSETSSKDMAVEATLWMKRVAAEVLADPEEFAIQAEGAARRLGSKYNNSDGAQASFLAEIDRLIAKGSGPATASRKTAGSDDRWMWRRTDSGYEINDREYVVGTARADAHCVVTGVSITKGMECYVRPWDQSDTEVLSRGAARDLENGYYGTKTASKTASSDIAFSWIGNDDGSWTGTSSKGGEPLEVWESSNDPGWKWSWKGSSEYGFETVEDAMDSAEDFFYYNAPEARKGSKTASGDVDLQQSGEAGSSLSDVTVDSAPEALDDEFWGEDPPLASPTAAKKYRIERDQWNGNRWQVKVYDESTGMWFDAGDARETEAEAKTLMQEFTRESSRKQSGIEEVLQQARERKARGYDPIDDSTRSFTLAPGQENSIELFTDRAVREALEFWRNDAGATQPNLPGYDGSMVQMLTDELARRTSSRKIAGAGEAVNGWDLSPSKRHPGENAITCPKCGSQEVHMVGTNLTGRPQPPGYVECRDCGLRTSDGSRYQASRKTANDKTNPYGLRVESLTPGESYYVEGRQQMVFEARDSATEGWFRPAGGAARKLPFDRISSVIHTDPRFFRESSRKQASESGWDPFSQDWTEVLPDAHWSAADSQFVKGDVSKGADGQYYWEVYDGHFGRESHVDGSEDSLEKAKSAADRVMDSIKTSSRRKTADTGLPAPGDEPDPDPLDPLNQELAPGMVSNGAKLARFRDNVRKHSGRSSEGDGSGFVTDEGGNSYYSPTTAGDDQWVNWAMGDYSSLAKEWGFEPRATRQELLEIRNHPDVDGNPFDAAYRLANEHYSA